FNFHRSLKTRIYRPGRFVLSPPPQSPPRTKQEASFEAASQSLSEQDPFMSSRTDDPSVKGARRLRLLFVDDEAPIRMIMGKELQRIGHDVTVVDGGKAAIDALSENVFDAAIVDLKMPEVDGWAVIEHIKNSGAE